MSGPRYAELQATSYFSFLRGASSCEELFSQAAVCGIEAVAVCDRNTVAGIVRAHEAAKVTGVRLIVGCRLELADGTGILVYPLDRAGWAIKGLRDTPLPLFDLGADGEDLAALPEPATALKPMTDGREVVEDYGTLGLSLRAHPVSFLRPVLKAAGVASCAEVAAAPDDLQRAGLQRRRSPA